MSNNLFQVDAFTSVPFRGNPAAVCLLDGARDPEWMQAFAAEMNLSETAFLVRDQDSFNIRWFTPTEEVDLCGHATLASAHILFTEGIVPNDRVIEFNSKSGPLFARQDGTRIILDFPAEPAEECFIPLSVGLAFPDTEILFCGKNEWDYLVEFADEASVVHANPDFALLSNVGSRGVIITSRSETFENVDFVSRGFFPNAGIPEDPVTGSAHCMLGPYWGEKLGKTELNGFQASKRGGFVGVTLRGARVDLIGEAVAIFKGSLKM